MAPATGVQSNSEAAVSHEPQPPPRRLGLYSMDREHLADITMEPTDLITHVISKIKNVVRDTPLQLDLVFTFLLFSFSP